MKHDNYRSSFKTSYRCESGMSVTAIEDIVGFGAVGDSQGHGSVRLLIGNNPMYKDVGAIYQIKVWEYYGYAVTSYSYNG